MIERKSYIYQIKNKINGKFYIGSTCNYKQRWYQHKYQLRKNTHGNKHLQNAWNKYGEENFEFIVLKEFPYKEQFTEEQEYLNKYNPFGNNGYNIQRKALKDGINPNYITKFCDMCGCPFDSYTENAKYCEECKKVISDDYFISLNKSVLTQEEMNIGFENCIVGCGYDSMDEFWECNGI